MTDSTSTRDTITSGYAGEDFVCRACGCEVMVKHWGEPRTHADSATFTCHCGQQMQPEHAAQVDRVRRAAQGGDAFDQEDFLGQGGGAPEPADPGATPSTGSSPGGGL